MGLVAAMTALVGCGSTGHHTTDPVTPDQAKTIALAYLRTPDYAEQMKHDVGELRALDSAAQAANPVKTPRPTQDPSLTHDVTVYVPHQAGYPATFFCYDGTVVGGRIAVAQLWVFSKPDAATPWSVNFGAVQTATSTAPDVALDSGGYAQMIPESRYGAFLVSPAKVGTDFGAYLRAGDSTDGREFAPGGMTSQFIESQNKATRSSAQTGFTTSYSYAPTGDPTVAYLLNDGGALVLTTLRSTQRLSATKDPIVITTDGKGITGPGPGKYREISTDSLFLLAFMVPPKGSADKVTGFGENIGTVRSTGTKA